MFFDLLCTHAAREGFLMKKLGRVQKDYVFTWVGTVFELVLETEIGGVEKNSRK